MRSGIPDHPSDGIRSTRVAFRRTSASILAIREQADRADKADIAWI
jgi:hypothetical protein